MFCLMFLPQEINNKLWRNHTISFKQIIFSKYATNLTPYHMIIHALQTVLYLNKKNIVLMYNYCVYNNIFWIFLIQMEYRLQSMFNNMVGRAATVEFYAPWKTPTSGRAVSLSRVSASVSRFCYFTFYWKDGRLCRNIELENHFWFSEVDG